MEFLGLLLALFLILLYLRKISECHRLRLRLECNEIRSCVVGFYNDLFSQFLKPKPIRNLQWSFIMKSGKIKLTWKKSVSDGVVNQPLKVVVNDVTTDEVLGPDVETYEFVAEERAAVSVVLQAANDSLVSDPVTLDFIVPALSQPEAPTDLAYEVVEVVEEPSPEPPAPPEVPVDPAPLAA